MPIFGKVCHSEDAAAALGAARERTVELAVNAALDELVLVARLFLAIELEHNLELVARERRVSLLDLLAEEHRLKRLDEVALLTSGRQAGGREGLLELADLHLLGVAELGHGLIIFSGTLLPTATLGLDGRRCSLRKPACHLGLIIGRKARQTR